MAVRDSRHLILIRFCRLVGVCMLGLACYADAARSAPVSIAVVPFGVARGSPPPPIDVARAIEAALASSGRFTPAATAAMPAKPTRMGEIRFDDWRRGRIDYLVIGLVATVHDGGYEVEFRLVDTGKEASLVGFQVPSGPEELRLTARRIAKIIDHRLRHSRQP